MKKGRFFLLLITTILSIACTSAPPRNSVPPPPPHTTGSIGTDEIVFALRSAERVKDITLRLSLYDRIIGISLESGRTGEGSAILAYASDLLRRNSGEAWFEEYSIVVAKSHLNLGEVRESERLLQESLLRIKTLRNDRRKRFLLEEIIGIGLTGGPDFQPLLRTTIDTILVLDDPGIKTELLIESARRFFGRGLIKDTRDLLQLTLSQIGSLESPWDKADIFSRIALVYHGLKDNRRLREYAGRAAAEIDAVQVIIRTEEEASRVGTTAENLLRLDFVSDAVRVAETIEYPWLLAETLCRMGIARPWEDFIDRAFETAAAIADNERRLTTLFQLDLLLVEAGQADAVAGNIPLREAELSALPALSVSDGFLSRLARLHSAAGDRAAATETARRIRDSYNRASALIAIARNAVEKGDSASGFGLLEESLALAETSEGSRDRILRDISDVYLLAGLPSRAAFTASGITGAYPFAAASAEISRYLLTSGKGLDAETRSLLEAVLNRV